MRAENPIKYSNARDSLSFAVYEELTGNLFRDNRLFLWMMLVLQWNCIARVNNIATLMFSMIDWHNDHLTLRFAKSKKDQLGDRCHTIRLFANPWNYKMCGVTALAIRLTEKGIRKSIIVSLHVTLQASTPTTCANI